MVRKWIFGVALLSGLPASADPAPTAAPVIVERLAAQDRILQARRKAFDYDLEIIREKLDDNRAVVSTSRENVVVRGDRRPDFGTRPNTSGAPEDESKKAAQEEPFELLKIIDHYNYALEGEEVIDGVLCYKIAFTPKPDMPYDNREEKVLNAVSGHMWASTRDFTLIRNEGSLMHPVSVAWIFASLKEMEFRYDSMQLPNGDYGPRQEQYRYLVNIPFFTLHERDTRKMSNYRPALE
jgi:hypothetical protein